MILEIELDFEPSTTQEEEIKAAKNDQLKLRRLLAKWIGSGDISAYVQGVHIVDE